MKAVVYESYGGPDVLKIIQLEKPVVQEDEILIEVGASGINPVDTYFRSGIRLVEKFPHIPHFDVSGTVVEIGSNTHQWKVGDRVWGTNIKGTAAQFISVKENQVFHLADHLTFTEGAALAMAFMTAHHALFYRAQLKPNEKILIFGGAGAVGHAAIQLAKQKGAYVISTAGNEEKANLALAAGANDVIDYKKDSVQENVLALTEQTGVDVILDVSLSENIERDLEMIAIGGRIVTIGSPKNNTPALPWRLLNMKNAALLGVLLFTVPALSQEAAGTEISKLFAERKLQALVGKTFTFEEAALAHKALENHQYNGSIVIVPE